MFPESVRGADVLRAGAARINSLPSPVPLVPVGNPAIGDERLVNVKSS